MSGALEKSLAILEYLTDYPDGAALVQIATELNQLRSGCHRTLHELIRYGYVRQLPQRGDYALTTKMASMGLSFLSKSGVVDISQPVINRLAQVTEELVRLAIVDGERLTLVAKAQGARSGLLYDPDMGIDLRLSCSAAGQAWLMTLPEDVAIEYVTRQGIGDPEALRPQRADQHQGLAQGAGRASQARLQHHPGGVCAGHELDGGAGAEGGRACTGVIVVAGPSTRLTLERMKQFGADVMAAAEELAVSGHASPLLKAANVGTWGNVADKPKRGRIGSSR